MRRIYHNAALPTALSSADDANEAWLRMHAAPTELTSLDGVVLARGDADDRQQEAETEAAKGTAGRQVPLQSGQSVGQDGQDSSKGQGPSERRGQRKRRAAPRALLNALVAFAASPPMDKFPRRRWPDFIRHAKLPAQAFGISNRTLDVAIDRPFLEKDDDFAIRTLPRIAALDSAGPVAGTGPALRAAYLDGIFHRSGSPLQAAGRVLPRRHCGRRLSANV